MPPWHGGTALLRGARVNWEVVDHGDFREAKSMVVELDCPDQAPARAREPRSREVQVLAHRESGHPFVGTYERCGLLASRPCAETSEAEIPKLRWPSEVAEQLHEPINTSHIIT